MEIKANRLVVTWAGLSYQHVTIIDPSSKLNVFEDNQIVFKDPNGTYIINAEDICLIELRSHCSRISGHKFKRVTLEGQTVFDGVVVIDECDYAKYSIPEIIRGGKQFAFMGAHNELFITHDDNIMLIECY